MLEPSNPARSPAELFRQLANTAQQIEVQWSPSRAHGILRGVERQRRQAQRRRAMVPMLCAASLIIVLASVASWAAFRDASVTWTWPWSSMHSTVIPQVPLERTTSRGHRGSVPVAPGAEKASIGPAPALGSPDLAPSTVAMLAPALTPSFEARGEPALQPPVVRGVVKPIVRSRIADRSHVAAAAPLPQPLPPPTASDEVNSTWQQLAHEGQFEQAYTVAYGAAEPASRAPTAVVDPAPVLGPGDLLLLADVARLSHHPADAVPPLNRLLTNHAADPRAPLAAFTLGRVLLDDLGRPREAADAFYRVQTLESKGPDGPLAQDALAREVEAWSRAGEPQRAKERAQQYVQHYPTGRRLRSVRHYGELD